MARKLLVIDDDRDAAGLIRDFLAPRGWDVRIARDGGSGLRAAEESAPDAIVLDIELPDMKGWEVCDRLKSGEALRAVPVIMVSGRRKDVEDRIQGLQKGADDYLIKPFSLKVLLAKLENILKASP